MNFPTIEDLDDLDNNTVVRKTIALIKNLSKIAEHFHEMEIDVVKSFYSKLVESLDEADELDSFGTEGWRYFLE